MPDRRLLTTMTIMQESKARLIEMTTTIPIS
jgi:hypothetical protein